MMGRMNMGKQIAEAPSSKGVKKMLGGGMATAMPKRRMASSAPPSGGAIAQMQAAQSAVRGMSSPKPAPGGAAAGFGSALAKLGAPKVGASGAVRGMAKGGKIDGCCMKGKTKGKMC